MSNNRSRRKRKSNLTTATADSRKSGPDSAFSERLAGITVKLAERVFQLENALNRLEKISRGTEYRSFSIQKLLEKLGISEADVAAKIEELQVEDFYAVSEQDNVNKGLVSADDGEVDSDSTVIISVQYFSDGAEVSNSKLLRSKVEVANAQIISEEFKSWVVGKRVGDSVDIGVSNGVRSVVTIHNILRKSPKSTDGTT